MSKVTLIVAADKKKKRRHEQRQDPPAPGSQRPFEVPAAQESEERRGGFFGRFNARLNDALQNSRGGATETPAPAPAPPVSRPPVSVTPLPARPAPAPPPPAAEPPAGGLLRRPVAPVEKPAPKPPVEPIPARPMRSLGGNRMIVPEGITIEGSIKGSGDTEIAGKVEGDVAIEGRMFVGGTAVITGNIRSTSCAIEGEVSGKIECKEDIELGQTGKLSSDITAGRRIDLAGQVFGNVSTPGVLRLGATSRVKGDLRVRNLVVEEGAVLNGSCQMRAPVTPSQPSPPQQQKLPEKSPAGEKSASQGS